MFDLGEDPAKSSASTATAGSFLASAPSAPTSINAAHVTHAPERRVTPRLTGSVDNMVRITVRLTTAVGGTQSTRPEQDDIVSDRLAWGKVASSPASPGAKAAPKPSGWHRRAPTSSASTSPDRCPISSLRLGHPADLAETVALVEATGRKIIASAVDIRDFDGVRKAVDNGVAALGRLDIVVANARICAPQTWDEITPNRSELSSTSTSPAPGTPSPPPCPRSSPEARAVRSS